MRTESAWHALDAAHVVEATGARPATGLAAPEAARRLAEYGPNVLPAPPRAGWPAVLGRQFRSVLILILVIAAALAAVNGETVDTIAILAIVVLNAAMGFRQEWKAEQALAALRRMLVPQARVLRDGREQQLPAERLVPGDVVLLQIGDHVPADLRLLRTAGLTADESALTGESVPVTKTPEPVAEAAPVSERASMAWMGTAVTNGRARGVVVATGVNTAFGEIARLTGSVQEEATPLQRRLAVVGRQLGLLGLGAATLVAAWGWLSGRPPLEMFMTGVSLAVAVVPEGLPAVVTLTLALGVRMLAQRRALLRRLAAAESLGAATVICTDKTGTLTQGEMTVQRVWTPTGSFELTGVGWDPAGHFEQDGARVDPAQRPHLLALLHTALRCNRARLDRIDGTWCALGEPTETALVVAAYKAWITPPQDDEGLTEFPFDSERKRMTVLEHGADGMLAHVKGAPEVILARCTRVLDGAAERELTEADRRAALQAQETMARDGLRTLAAARRRLPPDHPVSADAVEQQLVLLGLFGLADPPRPEVPAAMARARSAGLRVLMITGDAPATAEAVARQVGLRPTRVLTGPDLEGMDDAALRAALSDEVLFARTTPAHKLRIVTLLQEQGEIVGMTGDGVNDAPALKRADIGIAMGVRGTDVARGAADIVLTDDNFASIVNAIEEGRRQYDNIQKFIRYLLSSNVGEVVAILIALVLGGPLILLPVQILWMNLVTDGLAAVALGLEAPERDVMRRPPRPPREAFLGRTGLAVVLALGGAIGLVTLLLFAWASGTGSTDLARAQTVAFTGIILAELVNVLNFRSLAAPVASVGWFSNRWLLAAIAASLLLQIGVLTIPAVRPLLHTVPLSATDWLVMLAAAAPIFLVPEAWKWWRQRAAVA